MLVKPVVEKAGATIFAVVEEYWVYILDFKVSYHTVIT